MANVAPQPVMMAVCNSKLWRFDGVHVCDQSKHTLLRHLSQFINNHKIRQYGNIDSSVHSLARVQWKIGTFIWRWYVQRSSKHTYGALYLSHHLQPVALSLGWITHFHLKRGKMTVLRKHFSKFGTLYLWLEHCSIQICYKSSNDNIWQHFRHNKRTVGQFS